MFSALFFKLPLKLLRNLSSYRYDVFTSFLLCEFYVLPAFCFCGLKPSH